MSRPLCTDTDCERSVVRYRDGAGYCLFHPDAQPPVIDPKTGKPVVTTPLKVKTPKAPAQPKPRTAYRAPGRVVDRPSSRPSPADVAASYATAIDHTLASASTPEPDVHNDEPSTDLLTLQVAWKVTAAITAADSTRPAMRAAAREARRTLGILVDELTHDLAHAPATTTSVAAPTIDRRTEPLPCRKGCGKVSNGPQGRAGHERHCTHAAVSA